MGFFDRFGAGGGGLAIFVDGQQAFGGHPLNGKVVFTGGKRAQQITAVTIRLAVKTTESVKTPNGVQEQSKSADVAPAVRVGGGFEAQPGQTYELPFSIALPPKLAPSAKGHVEYSLHVAADIPGEIDPGASLPLEVAGAAMAMPAMPAPIGIGASVYAQWQDGQWYAARVVAVQNGLFGVDWEDPRLGQSTWVQPLQVRPS